MTRLRTLLAAFVAIATVALSSVAPAQTPNPVTPGYQVCTQSGGSTKCSFQPVRYDSQRGVAGLPMGAMAVTACGASSNTAGLPYVLEMDLTGNLCTSGSGGGGGLSVQDGATFTASTSNFTPTGGEYSSSPTTCADGKQCTAAITANRELRTHDADLLAAAESGVGTPGTASPATDIAIGGEGRSAEQTAVTNGQNVKAAFDLIGRQLTVPFAPKALWVQGSASSTDGSAHTIIAAASGSNKNYITDWECSNTSATAIRVTFNDSASTTVIVPAGGGNNKSLRIPLATAAATAFTFTSSSAVSTVYCSAQGFTGL